MRHVTPAEPIYDGNRGNPPRSRPLDLDGQARPPTTKMAVVCAVCCGLLLGLLNTPITSNGQELKSSPSDDLVPRWQTGDRWTVDTISRPLHLRTDLPRITDSSQLRWQFDVSESNDALSQVSFCVEVTCLAEGQGIPKTVFWVDRNSFALRRITTHLPVPGGFQEMTMSYESTSDQPAPVLGPFSALPIDTPVLYAGTKGMQTFSYTSHFGRDRQKELGDVGFAHQVEQQISEISADEARSLFNQQFAKSLLDDSFAKSLLSRPITEVRLKSRGREVRQLWQANRPWPIYCDNGCTVSRLVAAEQVEDRP